MQKLNTKEKILKVSLDLFSKKGYEATSLQEIAEKVKIRKASIFAHYKNKDDILNSIIKKIEEYYSEHSLLYKLNKEELNKLKNKNYAASVMCEQVDYLINNPDINKIRKLLTIEQYRNKSLCNLQQEHVYEDVLKYGETLIKYLIKEKVFVDKDPKVLAGQLMFPISVYINCLDRKPDRLNEIKKAVKKHVVEFYKTYER